MEISNYLGPVLSQRGLFLVGLDDSQGSNLTRSWAAETGPSPGFPWDSEVVPPGYWAVLWVAKDSE